MKFTIIASVAALAATAYAQGISVIQPTLGAVWYTGTTQSITWTVTNANKITGISLRQGGSANLDNVYTITTDQIDASAGKYEWNIKADTPIGADYSVQVSTDSGAQYSPYFTIMPGNQAPQSSGASPSSGASASGKPSGSASASGSASSSSASSDSSKNDESAASSIKTNLVLGAAAGAAALALF